MNVSILIIDDHKLLREAWCSMFRTTTSFIITGATGSSQLALQITQTEKPTVILLDVNLGEDVSGVDLIQPLLLKSPASKIIILTVHVSAELAQKIFKAGASGYVTKNADYGDIIDAIETVAAGGKYISPDVEKPAINRSKRDQEEPDLHQLTKRETEILQFILKGDGSKEIAEHLSISRSTVEQHRYHILKKLGLKNTISLVEFVMKTR